MLRQSARVLNPAGIQHAVHPNRGLAQESTIWGRDVEAIAIVQHNMWGELGGALTVVKWKRIYYTLASERPGNPDHRTGHGVGQTVAIRVNKYFWPGTQRSQWTHESTKSNTDRLTK